MKALLCREFGPLSNLALEEIPRPKPGPGELLVEVRAAALNFPDALIPQGLYQVRPPLPFSPGGEFSGIVAEVGEGVEGFSVGDRVIAFAQAGGFAQFCLARAADALLLPDGMDFEEGAAFILTYCTSYHALVDRGGLKEGETVLVLGGAGGVGLAAIQIAKALGANVIAAASSDEKLALCQKAGADEMIDYGTEKLKDRVLALTGGRGAEVVYDPVGGTLTETALRSLAWGGRLLVIGFAAGEIPKIPANLTLLMERSVIGVFWGEWAKRNPAGHAANLATLVGWFREGGLAPVITERVALEEAREAIVRMAGRKVAGKVLVIP